MNSYEAAMEEGTLYRYKFMEKKSNSYSPHELYAVAKYMGRDPDLWVFRRFGTLQLFNILCIQLRLTELETEFQRRISSCPQLHCGELLPEIQRNLKEYSMSQYALMLLYISNRNLDDALAAQTRLRSYLEPEAHVLEHMNKWSNNNELVLRKGLNINDENLGSKDLASVAATEKTWVHRFIDRHRRLHSLFEEKPASKGMWSTLIYHEESVRRAEAAFIHISFCILLLCPIVALLYVDSKMWKIIVMVVFLLAVSVLSVGLLNTPNKAGLALVAGYAAILVVFLSNNIGSG